MFSRSARRVRRHGRLVRPHRPTQIRHGPSTTSARVLVHGWRQVAAHVTVGSARFTDLTAIEAEALELVMFSPAELNVCHHGNNGTATNHLKRWTV